MAGKRAGKTRTAGRKVKAAAKKPEAYSTNKATFDDVMSHYRKTYDVLLKGGSKNSVAAKAAVLDWRCDVEMAVTKHLKRCGEKTFYEVYGQDSIVSQHEIDIEAFKRLGATCYSVEQRLGKAFIAMKLWRPRSERAEVREQEVDSVHVHPLPS